MNQNTSNFLVSSFLNSKRSLNKIYGLNLGNIAILRYICDSIDLNHKKRRSFSTRLYQSQIAKYCHCDLKTIRKHLKHLIKKRFIKYDLKKNIFTIGQILIAWGNIPYLKDIGKNSPSVRYRENFPTSNSSNLSNREKSYPQAKYKFWNKEDIALSAKTPSQLLIDNPQYHHPDLRIIQK